MKNLLYIHTHDSGRYISPYGYVMPTPNLQGLAEKSLLFRHAYCAAPTCYPSRTAMLTGMTAHSSGMLGLAKPDWLQDTSLLPILKDSKADIHSEILQR